ncbi:hypothetical protein COO60DRAFT_1530329 [Scenedesmus sp. NREL 46B-D3]|nr:hypothetical protein COO60DRAFT_1530329 [Scenedesmus sp. NREL 46B-D3]
MASGLCPCMLSYRAACAWLWPDVGAVHLYTWAVKLGGLAVWWWRAATGRHGVDALSTSFSFQQIAVVHVFVLRVCAGSRLPGAGGLGACEEMQGRVLVTLLMHLSTALQQPGLQQSPALFRLCVWLQKSQHRVCRNGFLLSIV